MTSKIKIRSGDFEVDFEGSEDFIKEDLMKLINGLSEVKIQNQSDLVKKTIHHGNGINMTASSIAAKLNSKTGADLVISACAHLHFVKKMESMTRKEILQEMKDAKSYFKNTYNKNLSRLLISLIKDKKLLESGKDIYSLEAQFIKELREKLA
jgi:hypothetical protein